MAVLGLKSLIRKLTKTIPDRVRKRTRAAMQKGADEMVVLAKQLVPVDKGDLRNSIGWTWGNVSDDALTLASSGSGDERITVFAGSETAFYVRWQEFGTQHMTPNPFFFPAYRLLRRRIRSRITREMNKAIKEGAR